LSKKWETLCTLFDSDSLPEETNEVWKLTDVEEVKPPIQNLTNCLKWGYKGDGRVLEKDKRFVDSIIYSETFRSIFDGNYKISWSLKKQFGKQDSFWNLYFVRIPENGVPTITDKDIASVQLDSDDQGEYVSIDMTPEGVEKWHVMTEENVDRLIAMCVNGVVLSAPNVINPITDGKTQISGSNMDNLSGIVTSLNRNSLEVRPIITKTTIVEGTPPILNALVQQMLIAVSSILLLFFSIMFVRNLRVN
jgi:hypothetical protein